MFRKILLNALLPGLLLLAFALQCVLSMRTMSATDDETAHLPAGLSRHLTGSIRLNPEHPPLIKMLCVLPLLPLHPRWDSTDPAYYLEQGQGMAQFVFGL